MNKLLKHQTILCLTILFHLATTKTPAQELRIVEGTMMLDGDLMPGVSVAVKGTTHGTITDFDGYYKIEAPLGAVIVFSFVGVKTTEMIVTEENSEPTGKLFTGYTKEENADKQVDNKSGSGKQVINKTPQPPIAYLGWEEQVTPFVFDTIQATQQVILKNPRSFFKTNDLSKIKSIKYLHPDKAISLYGKTGNNGLLLFRNFKQRYLRPPLLEYTSSISFQEAFRLSQYKVGNNLSQSFQKGSIWNNSIRIYDNNSNSGIKYSLNIDNNNRKGVIRKSSRDTQNANLWFEFKKDVLKIEQSISYNNVRANKTVHASSLYGILASTYVSPLIAENENNTNNESQLNTPDWLLNHSKIIDSENRMSSFTSISLNELIDDIDLKFDFAFEENIGKQSYNIDKQSILISEGQTGLKQYKRKNYNTTLTIRWHKNFNWTWQFEALGGYNYQDAHREVNTSINIKRDDENNNDIDSTYCRKNNNENTHKIHGLFSNFQLSYKDNSFLNFSMRNEFCKNNKNRSDMLKSASISLSSVPTNYNLFDYNYVLNFLKLYASYNYSENEAPLYMPLNYFNSTVYSVTDKYIAYFSQEITKNDELANEKLNAFNIGSRIYLLNSRIRIEFDYYRNRTKNLIAPKAINNHYITHINAGTIINKGYEMACNVSLINHSAHQWQLSAVFSAVESKVSSLSGKEERIPLAGFSEVSTNLIKGQPFGVIYGSKYLRYENGEVAIDNDGFPVVAPEAGIIGNPNPDWTAGIENRYSFKWLTVSFNWEFVKGGDIWNGTQNVVNYYREMNNQNMLNSSDWEKTRITGVAEDAIEDASHIKLNNIALTAKFQSNWFARGLPEISFSLWGSNLLCFSKNNSYDPSISIYGDPNGKGLNFFNIPSTRHYGFTLKLKI